MDTNTADQQITEVRANLSELLAAVRMLRRVYFLTSRGKRQAAIVPAQLGELIEACGVDESARILTEAVGRR